LFVLGLGFGIIIFIVKLSCQDSFTIKIIIPNSSPKTNKIALQLTKIIPNPSPKTNKIALQ
jgi:hypothetical protein